MAGNRNLTYRRRMHGNKGEALVVSLNLCFKRNGKRATILSVFSVVYFLFCSSKANVRG